MNTVENGRFENSVSIAPNPIDGLLIIQVGQEYPLDYIDIFNADGHLIKREKPETTEIRINSDTWPVGTYFIHLKSGALAAVKQVVKR